MLLIWHYRSGGWSQAALFESLSRSPAAMDLARNALKTRARTPARLDGVRVGRCAAGDEERLGADGYLRLKCDGGMHSISSATAALLAPQGRDDPDLISSGDPCWTSWARWRLATAVELR
jgi:hypothetical protein